MFPPSEEFSSLPVTMLMLPAFLFVAEAAGVLVFMLRSPGLPLGVSIVRDSLPVKSSGFGPEMTDIFFTLFPTKSMSSIMMLAVVSVALVDYPS